jgi:chemotaxis protein MotB
MSESTLPPIIIIKRKKAHAPHHGGAWKVAYADFVTAMMALFIVLWLLNSNADVRKAIGGYFQDPTGKGKEIGSSQAGAGESVSLGLNDMKKLKEKISQAINRPPEFKKMRDQVEMMVVGDGLRIELLDSAESTFFESGLPQPTQVGKLLLVTLAGELGKLNNHIMIEGHTDSKPYSSGVNGYSNWELSADRANSARRLMEENGVKPGQVGQVRGFADQSLRKPNRPEDPSNRRVSVIIQYLPPPESKNPAAGAKSTGHGEKPAEQGAKPEKQAAHEEKPPAHK